MKKQHRQNDCKAKFAEGGIAKVRHQQSTMDGKQKGPKSCPGNKNVYY